MKMNFITLCIGMAALLIGATGVVCARGLGPSWPTFGDQAAAWRYNKLGNAALAKGHFAEAKDDYQSALKAAPFNEDATLGLGRCAAAVGDYDTALKNYRDLVSRNSSDIDFITEFILVLQQANRIPEAVSYYNSMLDLCKKGYSVVKMDVYPSDFLPNGSDYRAFDMVAMTHVMRALNASNDDLKRQSAEMEQALHFAPHSSIVYYYEGVLLSHDKKPEALHAFRRALSLDHGKNTQMITQRIQRLQN